MKWSHIKELLVRLVGRERNPGTDDNPEREQSNDGQPHEVDVSELLGALLGGLAHVRSTPFVIKITVMAGGADLSQSNLEGVVFDQESDHPWRTRWVVGGGLVLAISGCTTCQREKLEVVNFATHDWALAETRRPRPIRMDDVAKLTAKLIQRGEDVRALAELVTEAQRLFTTLATKEEPAQATKRRGRR
ncbi:MAG: hypothetical protein Q7K39_04545 [Candidatus Magasanikbacteria bacterium]|nr:hypothetical protein [Candidatus Magasanikbacteria bacterium]